MNRVKNWFWNSVTAFNRFINSFVLFSIKPITFSKRSAEARNKGKIWGCISCRLLDIFDKGHCGRALLGD